MAEGDKKGAGPQIGGDMIVYAVPGILLVGFFVWVLLQMANQTPGNTLLLLVIGIAITLGGGGLLFWLLQQFDDDDD
jgi:hypothetical protein